jgi:hypothetical protein
MPYCKLLIINVYQTADVPGRTILIQLLGDYDPIAMPNPVNGGLHPEIKRDIEAQKAI